MTSLGAPVKCRACEFLKGRRQTIAENSFDTVSPWRQLQTVPEDKCCEHPYVVSVHIVSYLRYSTRLKCGDPQDKRTGRSPLKDPWIISRSLGDVDKTLVDKGRNVHEVLDAMSRVDDLCAGDALQVLRAPKLALLEGSEKFEL